MKNTREFLVCTLLILPSTAFSLHRWSGGYRTGVDQIHFNLTTEYNFQSYNRILNNQVFIAMKLGKRLEQELGLGYARKVIKYSSSFAGAPTIDQRDDYNSLILSDSLRCMVLARPRCEVYAQLGVTLLKPIVKKTSTYTATGQSVSYYNKTSELVSLPSALLIRAWASTITFHRAFTLQPQLPHSTRQIAEHTAPHGLRTMEHTTKIGLPE